MIAILTRSLRSALVPAVMLLSFASIAFASPSADWQRHAHEAQLMAPAAGERAVETSVRFAYTLPEGALDARLLVSRRAFDPTGWTAIESRSDLTVTPASQAAPTLEQAGVAIDSDTPLWWALAWRDGRDGTLRFSAVRPFTALRRFANRVADSPVLMRESAGRLADSDLSPGRAALAAGQAAPSRPALHMVAGYDFVPGEAMPAVPARLARVSHTPDEGPDPVGAYLVQFQDPPGDDERAAIAAAGGAVVAYVPGQAFLVRMTASALAGLTASRGDAVAVDYLPAFKLSPLAATAAPGAGEFDMLLFPDADLARARAGIEGMGATGITVSDNGVNRILRFTLDRAQLAAAAALADAQWIEPRIAYHTHNDNDQWVVQTGVSGNRAIWTHGLYGQGQVVTTTDSGIRTDHVQFNDPLVPLTTWGDYPTHRKIIAYYKGAPDPQIDFGDHSGASYHGTHTAGTVAGNDDPTANASARDGMAKLAKLWFEDLSGSALGTGISPPADLNDLYQPSYTGNAGGYSRLSSNSWGSDVAGAYTMNAQQVDQFMWTHPDYLIDISNGNASLAGTVGSPATAKNAGSVGGTGNGTSENSLYTVTSRGPCADGRRKPTFAAPGNTIYSANGAGTTGYVSMSGTSMACPSATGAIALIRQYCTDGWYPTGAAVPANGFSPSAALMKAMTINSCVDSITSNLAPNNNFGWGRVCVDSVLYFAGDSRRLVMVDHTKGLGQGDYVEYQVRVASSLLPLKVSLVWTDYPGNPAVTPTIVNDLDLTVSDGTRTYLGNVFTGRKSVTGGSRDSLNVEEGVRIPMPGPGVYTVRVAAKRVPVGPQPFALVVTGALADGAGTLAMDRTLYGATGNVALQVTDPDATGPLTVSVSSSTESTPEAVTLTGANGVFNGTIALTSALATADGKISVSSGDAITATYTDATYGSVLTARAAVSLDTPVITNVRATSQGTSGTQVTWTTDRNADSRVWYGLTPALELGSVSAAEFGMTHAITLSGLTPGQTYYYDVESSGLTGGTVRDDLGGAHRRFTAKGQGDILLVIGGNFSRTSTWTTMLDALGYDYDVWSGSTADSAKAGNLSNGLCSYKAVLWQAGPDAYPAFSASQRAAVDTLLASGGRLMTTGHDIGWGMVDATSPGYTTATAAWVLGTLKAKYKADPTLISSVTGAAGDVITGPDAAATTYNAWGTSGQSGDEIGFSPDASVTPSLMFKDDTPDTCAIRWTAVANSGSPSASYWGGSKSRLAAYFFEITGFSTLPTTADTVRNGLLDRTLTWLLGRQRPIVTVTSPNGGEVLATSTVNITWNESVAAGLSVASRTIEYSLDGGDSWTTLTTSAGPSPYAWDTSGLPNSNAVRVRVRIFDTGTPALGGTDASNAACSLMRAGADTQGPVVVAGSIQVTPLPIVTGQPATVRAVLSDAATGAGTVAAAEWSFGDVAATAGFGHALASTFDSVTVHASGALNTGAVFTGQRKLWVRAKDAAGNWGPATALVVTVNGTDPATGVETPAITFLAPAAPNPSVGAMRVRFGLARAQSADVAVFDAAGRRVRTLASGALGAGVYAPEWDGRDASGGRAAPGLYFVRLKTADATYERRLVRLD